MRLEVMGRMKRKDFRAVLLDVFFLGCVINSNSMHII